MHDHHINPDRCADFCDDQLPVFSRVGRGIKGNSSKVEIASDSKCETKLKGMTYDEATKTWSSDWVSENINGGCLSYQYNLRPFTIPQTFTITFIYRRPGRDEWSWTTPAIPYIWQTGDDGQPTDPDHMVGSGVATLYIKKTTEAGWHEKLVYPDGTGPEDFNTPAANEAWTVNLSFGVGGDIEVPNIDDFAKIIGITVEDIKKIINGGSITINGQNVKNLIEYIDKQDDNHLKDALDHVHADLGFNSTGHGENSFGGQASVKAYIDKEIEKLRGEMSNQNTSLTNKITEVKNFAMNGLKDIVNKVFGGGTVGSDGHITFNTAGKIAVGNMNLYGGGTANWIKTDADGENDVQVN